MEETLANIVFDLVDRKKFALPSTLSCGTIVVGDIS